MTSGWAAGEGRDLPGQHEHYPVMVNSHSMHIDDFVFEVGQIVVIKAELALQGSIRYPPVSP
jgi:hypothetical protein